MAALRAVRAGSRRAHLPRRGIARPHVVRSVTRDEATIVLAIDTTRSMAATDVRPSRFDAAHAAAQEFLDAVSESYRVGIVSFSTAASTVLTPTTDREAAKVALGELRLGSGTAIGNAIARSSSRLHRRAAAAQGRRALACGGLLLSDGAQTAGGMTRTTRSRRRGSSASRSRPSRSGRATRPSKGRFRRPQATRRGRARRRHPSADREGTGGTFAEAPNADKLKNVYRDPAPVWPRIPSASR